MASFSSQPTPSGKRNRSWSNMKNMVEVHGACQCGAVFWISGDFVILESGRADSDWECELCGSTVELYIETNRRLP